jgi:hypothetical protein
LKITLKIFTKKYILFLRQKNKLKISIIQNQLVIIPFIHFIFSYNTLKPHPQSIKKIIQYSFIILLDDVSGIKKINNKILKNY